MKSVFLLLALGLTVVAHAQSKDVKNLVDSQHYVFKARTAMPLSGRVRNLTYDYDLKVSKTAIVSYLPYYGQAYVAPMDPSKNALDFTSKDFEYTMTPEKKGGWIITIKPRDYKDVQQMTLHISSDGYATLQVISTSRQAISYNGVISRG
jgi:hypothetical protein